jgi:hypothetical protein
MDPPRVGTDVVPVRLLVETLERCAYALRAKNMMAAITSTISKIVPMRPNPIAASMSDPFSRMSGAHLPRRHATETANPGLRRGES